MYVKIDKPKTNIGGDNKGSSYNMLTYLEKENEGKEVGEKRLFFNQEKTDLYKNELMDNLDNNHKNLGANDTKFYSLSISPSQDEIKHLLRQVGIKKEISSIEELSPAELQKFEKELTEYSRGVMHLYAANFNRGLTGDDLVYGGKIEHTRTYDHKNKDVQYNAEIDRLKYQLNNAKGTDKKLIKEDLKRMGDYKRNKFGQIIKKGMKKEGLNTHVHIVVSRNNKEQSTKLSPWADPRLNDKHKVGDKECTIGFDRQTFKEVSGEYFNEKYNYKPNENEKYDASKTEYRLNKKSSEAHRQTKKALRQAKYMILKGTFKTEEKVLKVVLNPRKQLQNELYKKNLVLNIKNTLKDIALGNILER